MRHSYLEQKILGHSYLVPKNTGAQLFRGKIILGHSYFEPKNTGAQLFRCKTIQGHSYFERKNTRAQLFRGKTILEHSYLEQKNTRAQESGEGICMNLTRQMFARCTPSAKERSLVLLTHLTYYLSGRPKMNNSYYF